jgi:Phytanoyl-CoA dioxygenase (PhyH)
VADLNLRRRLSRRRIRGWHAHVDGDPTELLAYAQSLADDGRARDALALLTEANQARADAQLARRLVDLRFEAFAASEKPTEPPAWPADVDDLFAGQLIPEITHAELTATRLRSALTHHGSLLVRGFASSAQVERTVRDIDRALAAFDAVNGGTNDADGDSDGWFAPFAQVQASNRMFMREAGSVLAVDSPFALADLVDTFEQQGVGRLAADYFGEPPALLALKCSLRRVPKTARTGDWHQDGAFMGGGIRSLNIWLALTHCGDTAPGLDVVGHRLPGLVETGTEGAWFKWSVGNRMADRVGEDTICRPVFEAGDALIFDHLCLHRTAVEKQMTTDRHAIEAWFLAPSTYREMFTPPADGFTPFDQVPIAY